MCGEAVCFLTIYFIHFVMPKLFHSQQQHEPTNTANLRTEPKDYAGAFRLLSIVICIPFLLLVMRFWYLQVWQGEHYKQLAFNNFIKRKVIPAERGQIFDSRGVLVAGNRPAYDVTLTPAFFKSKDDTPEDIDERISLLSNYLSLSQEEDTKLRNRIQNSKREAAYSPMMIRQNITRDQVALIETNSLKLPGIDIIPSSKRYYPFNDVAAHQIGYVNQINDDELRKLKMYGYRLGDVVGRMGVERTFEAMLHGQSGLSASVVNARGMPQTDPESLALMKDWKDVSPIPGKNIILTINMDLQRILKYALRNYETGAIVAMNPQNGEIMAMASTPSFNPNSWSGRLNRDEHLKADNNPYKPMLDKTLLSYFPGSIYKVITAAAALETGLITPQEPLNCPGYYEYGKQRRRFHCWKHSGHDAVVLSEALASSCDVYFYKVGEKLGMDTLAEYAKLFGLGQKTGIGINNESAGVVPTKQWHNEHSSEGFQGGFTLSTSIGQGDTKTTPLQMAVVYSAIANGGTIFYPRIIDRIETAYGQPLFQYPVRVRSKLPFKQETLKTIIEGLDMVLNNEEIGTAYAVRLPTVHAAGKTGSAQVISRRASNASVEFKYRDHAWFASFAPVEKPEIVVVVFLEHGGSGGTNAAPVAMEVLDRYFREIKNDNPAKIQTKEE